MLDRISIILQQECKLHANNLLVVGVSGGPDSLCLVHVLHALGYPLLAACVNHGLRPQADAEVELVARFARQLGIDFFTTKLDVGSSAFDHSLAIEEASRTLRSRYLLEQAQRAQANAVLVGHSADDQVETILMHLLRGSGLAGLRGMQYRTIPNPWSEHLPLIRPFLSTWRDDILKYLAEQELIPASDHSNLDTTYFRNRLRYDLLPLLEVYHPGFRRSLLRMGRILKDDYEVLQQLANQAWQKILVQQGQGYLAFDLPGFLSYPLAIRRYVLRKAIAHHLPGLRDIDFDCIERAIALLEDEKLYARTDLMAGLRLVRDGQVFWLAGPHAHLPAPDDPAIPAGSELTLNIPAQIHLHRDWILQASWVSDPASAIEQAASHSDSFQA